MTFCRENSFSFFCPPEKLKKIKPSHFLKKHKKTQFHLSERSLVCMWGSLCECSVPPAGPNCQCPCCMHCGRLGLVVICLRLLQATPHITPHPDEGDDYDDEDDEDEDDEVSIRCCHHFSEAMILVLAFTRVWTTRPDFKVHMEILFTF